MLVWLRHEEHRRSRDRISPRSAEAYAFQFTGSRRAKALLNQAQGMLPRGTEVGEVVERALELLVKELERKKFKQTDRPRSSPPEEAAPGKRRISDAVKRAVYRRDGGRCTYVSPDGKRCTETRNLEFDHCEPVGLGGTGLVDRVCLKCWAHNQYAADEVYGRDHMDRMRQRGKAATLPGQGDPTRATNAWGIGLEV